MSRFRRCRFPLAAALLLATACAYAQPSDSAAEAPASIVLPTGAVHQAAGQAPDSPVQSSAVTGTVRWPDGAPARNAMLDIYPQGYPYGGQSGGEYAGTTDANGQYTINCGATGCTDLGMTFELTYAQNGGNYCYIIMRSDSNTYTVNAQPGGVINWTMMDMPCSRNYIMASSATNTIALLRANPQIAGGSWQHARQETGG